jgi:hypothetical protein
MHCNTTVTWQDETLASLVDRVTSRSADGEVVITTDLVARIKRKCRVSDSSLQTTFKLLFKKLKADDSGVRNLALDVVAELFQRSRLFRTLLASKFPRFLELVVGFKDSCALPPPTEAATRLRARGLKLVEEWDQAYGARLPAITIAHKYLRDTLGFRFPEIDARQAAAEEAARQREVTAQALARNQFHLLCQNWESRLEESRSLLQQFDAAYQLYCGENQDPKPRQKLDFNNNLDDGEYAGVEWEDVDISAAPESSQPQSDYVHEDDGTLLQSLHDTVTLRRTQALPSMHEALRVVVRGDTGTGEGDRMLRAATELKQALSTALDKYEKRKLDLAALSNSNKRRREQQVLESLGGGRDQKGSQIPRVASGSPVEPIHRAYNPYEYIRDPTMPNNSMKRIHSDQQTASGAVHAPVTGRQVSGKVPRDVLKSLAAKAPVLPAGPYIRVWDTGHDVPQYVSGSGLEVSNHWGPVDVHQQLPAERMEELFLYQPGQHAQGRSAAVRREGKETQRTSIRGNGSVARGAEGLESAIARISELNNGGAASLTRLRAAERNYNDTIVSHMTAMSHPHTESALDFEGVGGDGGQTGDGADAGTSKRMGKTASVRQRLERKISKKARAVELDELGLQDAERRRDRFGNRWEEK